MAYGVVPRTNEVIPGASVNIVLKADQRTGRQVSGVVRDVLTRGDHHRGIKVRLADGRIGRVQSMASAASDSSSSSASDPTAMDSLTLPVDTQPTPLGMMSSRGRGQRPCYRDVRLDEPLDVPPEQIDLAAYIVPAKRKGKGRKNPKTDQTEGLTGSENTPQSENLGATRDLTTAIATCPVCGAFEGDEAAVAHHVAEHFE
ncbi:hypothetical protein F5X99DRAFT_363058 [Biscogniauxia marginata]|nr:hypothetical protein F5X99DRAFT_363058 [Biscogniauxia marginata]